MILSFRTDRSGQTVQTQSSVIRVYTVCNSLCTFWTHYSTVNPRCSNFRVITANFSGVRFFRIHSDYSARFQAWILLIFMSATYRQNRLTLRLIKYKFDTKRCFWYISITEPAHEIMVLITWATNKRSEPSLFAHMKYRSRRPNIRHLAPPDGFACAFEEWVYGGRKVQ